MLSDAYNFLQINLYGLINYIIPKLLNTGMFVAFYILIAIIYGYLEFGKKLTPTSLVKYLLPRDCFEAFLSA